LQPGGALRGFGRAGKNFAEAYAPAVRADQDLRKSTALMNINLANAQRAENMGLGKEAMTYTNQAIAAGKEASKAERELAYKKAELNINAAKAFRPPSGRAGGAGAGKPNPTIYSIEAIAADLKQKHANDPEWTPEKIKAEAVGEYNRQTKAGTSGTVASVVKEARKSVDDHLAVSQTRFKKFANEKFDGDQNKAKQFLYDQALEGYPPNMYIPKPGSSGGGGTPAPAGGGGGAPELPPGFVRQ
jgi:hypothetical protein